MPKMQVPWICRHFPWLNPGLCKLYRKTSANEQPGTPPDQTPNKEPRPT